MLPEERVWMRRSNIAEPEKSAVRLRYELANGQFGSEACQHPKNIEWKPELPIVSDDTNRFRARDEKSFQISCRLGERRHRENHRQSMGCASPRDTAAREIKIDRYRE